MVNITTKSGETGKEITIDLERNGRPVPQIRATPRADPPPGEGALGAKLEEVQAPVAVAVPEAFGQAVSLTGEVVGQIAELPGQLLSRPGGTGSGAPTVGGPIEIFRVTGQIAQFGIPTFLKLIGVLSVNLGVINIIPFPGLDGGRLFFVLVGGIFRRRLSPQVVAAVVDTRRPAVITRSGHPVAVLVPLDAASTASALEDWALAHLPEFVRSRAAADRESAAGRTIEAGAFFNAQGLPRKRARGAAQRSR